MSVLKADMTHLQSRIGDAFSKTGALVALADAGNPDPNKIQRTLETISDQFERATLELRCLCEQSSPGTGGYMRRTRLASLQIAGSVEMLEYTWLHIQINTLLPHCRYQTPAWLTDIQNTSGPKETDDFWSRAELNLLMALIHYVVNLKDANGNLLPIEERGLGKIYKMLAEKTVAEINATLAELPPEHPAKGPHGLFLKAKENLWGNIVIGLGNRLAIYQSQLVDTITRNHDVDLTLPGKQPCAYFVIISAQDSAYRFLSSLFFSLAIPQLSD